MVEKGPNPLGNLDLEEIFAAIAKGNFGLDVTQQIQEEPAIGKGLKYTFIAKCIAFALPQRTLEIFKEKKVDIREVAKDFRRRSTSWKDDAIVTQLTAKRVANAEIIKSITYEDMTEFAKGRSEEFQKEAGRAVPFSNTQKQMQERARYWEMVGQVVEEAAIQEKKDLI